MGSHPDIQTAAAELLGRCEARRRNMSAALTGTVSRSENGQFFTPAAAAQLLASMPALTDGHTRVLDPGAGTGILSAALVARWMAENFRQPLRVVAVERDAAVIPALRATLADCVRTARAHSFDVHTRIIEGDFIHLAGSPSAGAGIRMAGFDLVVQNPPYGKLPASSEARRAVKLTSGVDVPNLYAAFLTLGVDALRGGGQLVALTPRSFCNGPYFGEFRARLLDRVALDRVHVFESRGRVFADTGVLQETVMLSATVGGARGTVTISQSLDHQDAPTRRAVPHGQVVDPCDPHRFIRLAPNDGDERVARLFASLPCTPASLGVHVSTGRVVEFRCRTQLHTQAAAGRVPLVHPGNLTSGAVVWPREIGKPQWFSPDGAGVGVQPLPEGHYVAVKRFSAKEERRRIVAALWSPRDHPGPVAFENHVNVIHAAGAGLDEELAAGLTAWLNSAVVDRFFRTFSGHTQVNATDLRTMRFPDAAALRTIGRRTQTASEALAPAAQG